MPDHVNKKKEADDIFTYPVKVVDDIGGVAASEVWHGYADLLVVVLKVDADVFLQLLLPSPQRSVHGFLVDNPAVEQAVSWDLLKVSRNRSALVRDPHFGFTLLCRWGRGGVRTHSIDKVVAIGEAAGYHQS